MKMFPGIVALVAGLSCLAPLSASEPDREPLFEGLGGFGRPVTTSSPEAQQYFDQGLCFLYAFNHDEAVRNFRQATRIDPDCAMAWWGLATALGPHINYPIVPEDHAKEAWQAIGQAQARLEAVTDAERALIEAASTRFAEDPAAERRPLDEAYAEAMARVWQAHPDDADIGALYAEALMDLRPWDLWTPEGKPQPGTEHILATLEQILEQDPDHPLACHLYIHAVEASPEPGRAAEAADRLRYLQPGLPHMVHMPSHIDVRIGKWEEAADTNQRAIESDRSYLAVRPDQGFYRLYMLHDYHMLAFAAMMRGERARALETIDEMIEQMPLDWAIEHGEIADGYFAMPLEVRVRFGLWDEVLAYPEPNEAFPLARALWRMARGVSLAALDRIDEARQEQAAFREARTKVAEDARFGNSPASTLLDVAEHLLEGEILYRAGQEEPAFEALRQAIKAEDALNYSEPPDWIQPVRHALGAALMRSGRVEEAEAVYREDLERQPENGWSLFGLMSALELQGKTEEANTVRERWEAVWKDSDVELISSCFCLPFI